MKGFENPLAETLETQLPPNDPALDVLKKSSIIQTVRQHFGEPDWNAVLQVRTKADQRPLGYVMFFPVSADEATFLALTDPEGDGPPQGVVGQARGSAQQFELKWHTPHGQHFAVTSLGNGKLTSTLVTETAENKIAPRVSGRCFVHCIESGASGLCLAVCYACAVPWVQCLACTGCAGARSLYCLWHCR